MNPQPIANPNIFNCDTIYPAVKEYKIVFVIGGALSIYTI